MTTEQTHNWKITISCYGKLQNDRSSQVDMENATNAIQKVLLAGKSTLAPHEIFDLVNCLRAILQLWTKGDQSPSNPWSQICIDASSVLVRVLTRPGNSADLMSRSSKLIMFVFARAPLMGEATVFEKLLPAVCALIASLSDAELELLLDPNIDKMIQYFSQITRDLCGKLNKLQLSPEVFHTLGESCLNCVRDAVLVKVQAAVSDHVGKTKLALCVNEAAFAWCVAAEARDEARDLATRVRQQVFETVLARPCSAVLSKLVELQTRHLNALLRKKQTTHAQSLRSAFDGELVCALSRSWAKFEESLSADEEAPGSGSLKVAAKLLAWLQVLRGSAADGDVVTDQLRTEQQNIRSLLISISDEEERLGRVPAGCRSGWELLAASLMAEQALANSALARPLSLKLPSSPHHAFNRNSTEDIAEVEKELIMSLFNAVVAFDLASLCRQTADKPFEINCVRLFCVTFPCDTHQDRLSCDCDPFSFKVVLAILSQLLLSAPDAPLSPQSTALNINVSALALAHVTANLTWTSLLNVPCLEAVLKYLANLLLRAAASPTTTLSAKFQEDYCLPLFQVMSDFFTGLLDLFCSDFECSESQCARFSGVFDVLGEVMSLVLHCCSNLCMKDCRHPCVHELMNTALELFDVVNVSTADKQKISSRYAKHLVRHCAEVLVAPSRSWDISREWGVDVSAASHFLTSRATASSLLVKSCRHDAVDYFIQEVRVALEADVEKSEHAQRAVAGAVRGLHVLLGGGAELEKNRPLFDVLRLTVCSTYVWSLGSAVELSAISEEGALGRRTYDAAALLDELQVMVLGKGESSAASSSKRPGKAGTKKPKAKSVGNTQSSESSILASRLKAVLLMLQWTFSSAPRSAAQALEALAAPGVAEAGVGVEPSASGLISGYHLASAGLCLWKELLKKNAGDEGGSSLLVDFYGDSYLLFHFLGLHGRVHDQIEILVLLSESLRGLSERGGGVSTEIEQFLRLVCSLKCHLQLWLVFNGLSHKVAMLLQPVQVAAETPWSLAISAYIAQAVDILHAANHEDAVATIDLSEDGELCSHWSGAAESLFQLCRTEKLHVLAAQVALLHGKVLQMAAGLHEASLKWAKYALVVLKGDDNPSPPTSASVCADTTPLEMEAMLLVAELHESSGSLDRFSSYVAEAKALAACSASPVLRSLYSLHALRMWYRTNSKRAMLEVDSIRACRSEISNSLQSPFALALSEAGLLPQSEGRDIHANNHLVLDRINDAALFLVSKIQIGSSGGSTAGDAAERVTQSALDFRYLKHQWGFSPTACRAPPASPPSSCPQEQYSSSAVQAFVRLQPRFHSALSGNMRRYLETVLGEDCSRRVGSAARTASFSGVCSTAFLAHLKRRLQAKINGKPMLRGESFDVVRSLRRRFSVDSLSHRLGEDGATSGAGASKKRAADCCGSVDEATELQAMYAFALAAASCGTAVETSLENKSDVAKDRSSQLSGACAVVQQICGGDDAELRRLMTLLDHCSPREKAGGCAAVEGGEQQRRPVVTCILTLEHSTRQVIIGRKEAAMPFPFVVAAPCYDALLACAEEWGQVIAMNTRQLARTRDHEAVKLWSEQDKADWWMDRAVLDERISRHMEDVQAALGPWRCLLTPCCSLGRDFPEQVATDIRHVTMKLREACAEVSGAKLKSPKKSKTANFAVDLGIEEHDAKVRVLLQWIHLVSTSGALTSDERIEGLAQLLSFFLTSSGGAVTEVNENFVREAASEIWEITTSFKAEDAPGVSEGDELLTEHQFDDATDRKRYTALKVPELRKLLRDQELDQTGKKAELIDRMLEHSARQHQHQHQRDTDRQIPTSSSNNGVGTSSISNNSSNNNSSKSESSHVVLVLDELLQAIPFENMPLLRHKEVSRVPGLAVLVNLLLQHSQTPNATPPASGTTLSSSSSCPGGSPPLVAADKLISLARCWYSIDPDANLQGTRATMTQFMQPYAAKWGWTGFVGEKPPAGSVKDFHENADLFVFCGHGCGDKLFDKQNKLRKLKCPAAMLWGCSSGALSSNGVHDPIGTCIAYLLGGAPFVIGNLWDVTDKDIDKLSVRCMSSIFDDDDDDDDEGAVEEKTSSKARNTTKSTKSNGGGGSGRGSVSVSGSRVVSVSSCLSLSRGVCRLKAAVGFAPVMYGLPVGVDTRR